MNESKYIITTTKIETFTNLKQFVVNKWFYLIQAKLYNIGYKKDNKNNLWQQLWDVSVFTWHVKGKKKYNKLSCIQSQVIVSANLSLSYYKYYF